MSATNTYGATDDGFVPRQLADIQKQLNGRLALIVDPVTGERPFQNAGDDPIHQQIVAILAKFIMEADNATAWAALMRDPLSAIGAMLSAIVQLNGITRNAGERTIIPMTLAGDPGTLIPRGARFTGPGSEQVYALNEDVVLPLSGTATMGASCTVFGSFEPEANTIVTVQTPVAGLLSATNGAASSVGTEEETDERLRLRQQQSTSATAYRQIESIRAAVLNIEGVTFCRAYQNSGVNADERGIPGKALALVVVGGDSRRVAEAMFLRSPLGIRSFGDVTETFTDDQSIAYPVSFSRPVERFVSVEILLHVVTDEGLNKFPSDGVQRIKNAIVEFAEYGSHTCEPLGNDGFPPGQNIIASYLYTPINSIGGARIESIRLGIDGSIPEEADEIEIAWNEIGLFDADRIEVNFT